MSRFQKCGKVTAVLSCNHTSYAHNAAAGWQTAVRDPPFRNCSIQTHTIKPTEKKLRGKSLGEKPPPMVSAGWWDVGLIKSCCRCSVLVTRSHTITEIYVWEESAPTTHFLPDRGGGQNGTVCCTKYQERENHFSFRGICESKRKERAGVGEEGWGEILLFLNKTLLNLFQ